jgi:hypothetical protein
MSWEGAGCDKVKAVFKINSASQLPRGKDGPPLSVMRGQKSRVNENHKFEQPQLARDICFIWNRSYYYISMLSLRHYQIVICNMHNRIQTHSSNENPEKKKNEEQHG